MVVQGKMRVYGNKKKNKEKKYELCEVCATKFEFYFNKKYCSAKCRREKIAKERGAKCKNHAILPSSTVGAIGELLVCIDLMRRGYTAFRCVSPNSKFDLVACRESKFLKIEATTGTTLTSGKVSYAKKNINNFDHLAIVVFPDKIIYDPPLDDVQEQS